jgi:CelD/BcsL family acetyltransferase involved in cellulose biosynthesis
VVGVIRVRAHEAIGPIEGAWDELATETRAIPFVRPQHVRLHRSAFGGGRLRVVTVQRDGELVAVLPLHVVRGSWRTVTNWHTPSNALLVRDEGALAALVRFLRERAPARTELRFLFAGDGRRLRAAVDRQAGFVLRERVLERSPYVQINGQEQATYLARRRTRFLRDLRRRRRRLDEQGGIRVAVHDGRERFHPLLERGLAIEASGWKGAAGSAIAASTATRSYYTNLAAWARDHGWLRLAYLEVGGRAIAFDLGLEHDGRHHLIKTGYDPEWRVHAPGQLLRQSMLERAFAMGLETYEFGGDDDPYKLEWTEDVRIASAFDLHPTTLSGQASVQIQERLRPVARRALTGLRDRGAAS